MWPLQFDIYIPQMSSLLTCLTQTNVNVNAVDMTERKASYHHGDLVAQIERIAWDKIQENGADKLSLRSCARDAGVDAAAVYRHFKSKDDLLGHLANRAFAALSQEMETAQAKYLDTDPKQALVQIGLAYINYAVTEPHIFQMMFNVAGRYSPSAPPPPSTEGRTAYDILVQGIARLNPATDINVHVFTLWSLVHGFSELTNTGLGPEQGQFEQISRKLCENAVETIS